MNDIVYVNILFFGNVGKDVMLIVFYNIKLDVCVIIEVVVVRQVVQIGFIFNIEFFYDSLLIRYDENQFLFGIGKVFVDNVGVFWFNEM